MYNYIGEWSEFFLAITWIKQTFCNFFLYNKIYVRLIILLGWLLFLNRSFTINVETRAQVDDSNDIWYFFFFLKSGYIWARTIVLCMGGGCMLLKSCFYMKSTSSMSFPIIWIFYVPVSLPTGNIVQVQLFLVIN